MDMVSTSPIFCEGKNVFGKNFAQIHKKLNQPVTIGNDVWIGEGVFIGSGITVGNGAVIGAHSVVTHDVPPYAIAIGAPARILRYRFSEEEIIKLLNSNWWTWSEEKLMKLGSEFESVDKILKVIEEIGK